MRSDCEELKESSIYVKRWIRRQPAVKEESITDWILYDVSEKINGMVYRAFSRHQEARQTGADWEWWFLFPDFSAKMRVQAKKVDPANDNYASIAHTNRYGLQIQRLLQDSQNKDFMPFYAFYTALKERTMCPKTVNDEGVFMAGGNRVYTDFIQDGKNRVMASDILSRCVALSCFLCCPLNSEDRGNRGFIRFLSRYYTSEIGIRPEEEVDPLEREEIRGIYRKVPGYVASFVEHAREGLPDWWEEEFRGYIEGVNSLIVYDARGEKQPNKRVVNWH